ncbi:MAG: hypothetical protein ACK5N8_01775 [Alphaproteobacteria bacterium]
MENSKENSIFKHLYLKDGQLFLLEDIDNNRPKSEYFGIGISIESGLFILGTIPPANAWNIEGPRDWQTITNFVSSLKLDGKSLEICDGRAYTELRKLKLERILDEKIEEIQKKSYYIYPFYGRAAWGPEYDATKAVVYGSYGDSYWLENKERSSVVEIISIVYYC